MKTLKIITAAALLSGIVATPILATAAEDQPPGDETRPSLSSPSPELPPVDRLGHRE
jgi:hypothetical protein